MGNGKLMENVKKCLKVNQTFEHMSLHIRNEICIS